MTPNETAWVDRVLSAHWDKLRDHVGPELLPRVRATRTRSEMKRGKITAEEFGCGHYGCVMPTAEPNTVVKLTTDGTEASFVSHALEIAKRDGFPEGIVRYQAIYKIPDASYRRRDVYVLWREEAEDVGGLDARGGVEARFLRRLSQFLTAARDARERLERASSPSKFLVEARGLSDWAEDVLEWDDVDRGHYTFPRQLTGARAFAWRVRAAQMIAELMVQEDVGYLVGGAFGFYMDHGILLADVHPQNIGRVHREDYQRPVWAITDPGHMVPLAVDKMDFRVEEL